MQQIKPNLKRSSPLLWGLQQLYEIEPLDGLYGPKTEAALSRVTIDLSQVELEFRAMEIIGLFEVGNVKNPWYAKTVVKSEGWKNYGIVQHNKLGSLKLLKNFAQFTDPEEFFKTPECIPAQVQYFHCYVVKKVIEFGFSSELDFLCKADALVQGGTLYPSRAPRSWEDWRLSEELLDATQGLYKAFSVKEAFSRACQLHPLMFAELHPRSGHPLYLGDQLARRRCCATGVGVVHGSRYVLSDWGFPATNKS